MKYLLLVLTILMAPTLATAMDLSSQSISAGVLNTQAACEDLEGQNVSPQLTIANAPADATHFAIILDDPDANALDGKTWVHWNVINIPAATTSLAAGQTPSGMVLANDDDEARYAGLCPSDGRHKYRLTALALSAPLNAGGPEKMTLEAFVDEYEDVILDRVTLEGVFP